ncbi:MAG: polysaccharide biosynthesis C-terminal domain-containing protein [Oscillospiraceae bacterium]|nr:polysaccharide biosynthesis C-terminal domain-containing protein [Oscillospiraceae bacterium]
MKSSTPDKAAKTDSTNLRQSLVGGAMVLTVAMIVTKVVGIVYAIPLKAVLDKSGVGIYAQAHGLYEIIYSLALAGFPTAISKIIVDFQRQGRYSDIKRLVKVTNFFFLALGLIGSLTLALLAGFYSEKIMDNPNITLSILVVAPSIIFSCLMSTHRGYHQGMRNMIPTAISQVIESIAKCIIGLSASYLTKAYFTDEYIRYSTVLGRSYNSFAEAYTDILSLSAAGAMVGVTLSILIGWLYLIIYRRTKGDNVSPDQLSMSPEAYTDRYLFRQILTIGLPITFAVIATQITSFIGNAIIQNRLITSLEKDISAVFASHSGWLEFMDISKKDAYGKIATDLFGCYSFGDAFFFLAPALCEPFRMSALPHVAESWLQKNRQQTEMHINLTLKFTSLISSPIGFGLASLATPIMHMVYAKRNTAEVAVGGPLLSVLATASVFLAIYATSNTILNAIGRHDIPVKLLLLGGLLNLVITYILVGIPSINIKGAPVGNVFGYILIAVLSLIFVYRNTHIDIDIFGSLIKPLIAGFVCALASYGTYTLILSCFYHLIRQRIATVIAIAVGAVIYIIAIGLMKVISKQELESIVKKPGLVRILSKLRIVR